MWHLRSLKSLDIIYYLPCDGQYIIGRKDCPIIITEDQSISRKHALLTIKSNKIMIQDLSKFGTEVNRVKITNSTSQILHHNDVIKFGQGNSLFKLVQQPLVFCCSNMSGELKLKVQDYANKLGGKMVSNWSSSCTHLVMTGVTITVKVVNTLSSCCPIVSLQWLEDSVKCKSENKPLPLTNSYIPELVDANLLKGGGSSLLDNISLKPLYDRKKLFTGKNIYFLNETQYSNLKYALKSGGGTVHLLTTPTNELARDDNIIIDPINKTHPLLYTVKSILYKANMRLISESEIGYAVLYCSIEQYCNPTSTCTGNSQLPVQLPQPSLSIDSSLHYTQHQQGTQSTDVSTVLAYNTEIDSSLIKSERDEKIEGERREVVNETIIKQESMNINELDNSSSLTQSSINNSTILAPDSFPVSQQLMTVGGGRKRNRNEEKKDEKSLSLSTKKTKLNKVSDAPSLAPPLSTDVSSIAPPTDVSSLAPPPPATPPKFLSTRRVSPHKSPFLSLKLKPSSPLITQLSTLQSHNEGDTQENPLPKTTPIASRATPTASNLFEGMKSQRSKRDEITPINDIKIKYNEIKKDNDNNEYQRSLMVGVFISARKKPTLYQPISPSTDNDDSIDTTIPLVPVETVSLVINRSNNRVLYTDNVSNDGVMNFKKFKKVTHPNCLYTSTVSRLIGGNDLKIYNQ